MSIFHWRRKRLRDQGLDDSQINGLLDQDYTPAAPDVEYVPRPAAVQRCVPQVGPPIATQRLWSSGMPFPDSQEDRGRNADRARAAQAAQQREAQAR